MELFKLVCPSCGADIILEKSTNECFCPYCGNKFLFDDGVKRSEHTVYIRDEAKLRELELKEEARQRDDIRRNLEKQQLEKKKQDSLKRWYYIAGSWTILFLGFVLAIKYGVAHKSSFIYSNKFDILLGAVAFAPVILPAFYPYEYSEKSRAVSWIKWSLIMYVFLAFVLLIFGKGYV